MVKDRAASKVAGQRKIKRGLIKGTSSAIAVTSMAISQMSVGTTRIPIGEAMKKPMQHMRRIQILTKSC